MAIYRVPYSLKGIKLKLTANDIAKFLGVTKRAVTKRAIKESWPHEIVIYRGGRRHVYDLKDLPEGVKLKILTYLKSHPTPLSPPLKRGEDLFPAAPPAGSARYAVHGEGFISLPSPGNPAAGGWMEPPVAPFTEETLMNLPDKARRRAFLWERIIHVSRGYIKETHKTETTEYFIAAFNAGHIDQALRAEAGRISRGTLYRKISAYNKEGLRGLVPNYKGRERDIHPDVAKKAVGYFLERPRKVRRILDYLKKDFPPEIVPTYSALVRFLNAWGAEHPQEVCMAHWGENRWKKKFLPAFGSASEEAPYPNHTWEVDSTVADIMTTDGKRHKLVACVDVHSRLCPSITMQPKSNAWGIVDTLARGFEKYGIPERLKKDNGKDYASKWVAGFLRDLNIACPKLPIKTPEKKPHVERFFREVSEKLLIELTGYTGNCLVTRPEEIKVNYTSEEFAKILQSWVEHEYNEAVPATTGQPRRERFFAPGFRMRKVTPGELELLTHPQYTRSVGKKGISFDTRLYTAPELVGFVGKRVTFRLDITDISKIAIFKGSEFYCHAHAHGAAAWPMEKYLEEKRSFKKALKATVRAERELARGSVKDRMLKHLNDAEETSPLRFPPPEDITKIIDISKCSIKEPAPEKTPYDEFPAGGVITELPTYEAYLNYQYLLKGEVLGLRMAPHILKWRDDYVNGKLEFLERDYYNHFVKYHDDPHFCTTFDAELERLKRWAAKHGRNQTAK